MCGPSSRWKPGNAREQKGDREVLDKFKEQPGWRNGARVRKKG